MAGAAAFAAGFRVRFAVDPCGGPGIDLSQPGAAKQPFSAPGALLEVRGGKEDSIEMKLQRHVSRNAAGNADPLRPAGRSLRRPSAPTTPGFVRHFADVRASRWRTSWTGLLQGYVRLLHAEHQHREYLRYTNPGDDQARGRSARERTLDPSIAQGAGDQSQTHRDPDQAAGEVRARFAKTAR